MYPGIHNYSEIGKLNKVLLHRPGLELEALTPTTMERLLFDDIPFLKIAQEEHDIFVKILEDNGAQVLFYVDETAKALADTKVRLQFINEFLDLSDVKAQGLRESIIEFLMSMEAKAMVSKLIAGVKKKAEPFWPRLFSTLRQLWPYGFMTMPRSSRSLYRLFRDMRRAKGLMLLFSKLARRSIL